MNESSAICYKTTVIYEKYKNEDEFASYLIGITSLDQFWQEKEPHPDDEDIKAEALKELEQGEPLEEVLLNLKAREMLWFRRVRTPDHEKPDPRFWSKPDQSGDDGLFQNVVYSGSHGTADRGSEQGDGQPVSDRPVSVDFECGYHDARRRITRTVTFPDRPRSITMSQWHWDALAWLEVQYSKTLAAVSPDSG